MTHPRVHPNYVAIWGWLVGLLIVGVASTYVPFPRAASLALIFGAALGKALLVSLTICICASNRGGFTRLR
jgi:hypothetical protein